MMDRNGKEIQRGDIVNMSGDYFPEMDGLWHVLRVSDRVHLQKMDTFCKDEHSIPRDVRINTTNTDNIEIIGKAFCIA